MAALIEPFTVGCRAARRGMPQKGEKAVVFGAGTIGIAAAIALKYFGCERVVICDYSDFRLEICKQLGFEIYNNKKDTYVGTIGTGLAVNDAVCNFGLLW